MMPAFKPGDHVLTFNWGKYRKNDLIVFKRNEAAKGQYYLKRVDNVKGDQVMASAENKKQSIRIYKLSVKQIVGKVILKY